MDQQPTQGEVIPLFEFRVAEPWFGAVYVPDQTGWKDCANRGRLIRVPDNHQPSNSFLQADK